MQNGTHTNGTRANGVTPTTNNLSELDLTDWDALSPKIAEALSQPLDSALVSERKGRGGRRFSYLEGHTTIDQANQVFGYGGWGYELVGDVTQRQIEQTDSNTGEATRTTAYSATVRVTVPGAPSRTDVGFHPVSEDSAEGHETAYKSAVTDALKRALRSFGDRFGNGLYGDPPTNERTNRQSARVPQRSRPAPTQSNGTRPRSDEADARNLRDQLIELSAQQGFSEEQVRAAVQQKTDRDLDELGIAELTPLIASAADKLQQRQRNGNGG